MLYAVAHFWDIICSGLFLGHLIAWPSSRPPPSQCDLFPGSITFTPAVGFRVELIESYNELSIIGLANGIRIER
jgi:hypothetical protein